MAEEGRNDHDVEGLVTDDMMGSNPRLLSFLFCGFNPRLSFAYDTRSASRSEAEASGLYRGITARPRCSDSARADLQA